MILERKEQDQKCFYSECKTMEELAYKKLILDGELGEVPDPIRKYIDYVDYGNFLYRTGNYEVTDHGIIEYERWVKERKLRLNGGKKMGIKYEEYVRSGGINILIENQLVSNSDRVEYPSKIELTPSEVLKYIANGNIVLMVDLQEKCEHYKSSISNKHVFSLTSKSYYSNKDEFVIRVANSLHNGKLEILKEKGSSNNLLWETKHNVKFYVMNITQEFYEDGYCERM